MIQINSLLGLLLASLFSCLIAELESKLDADSIKKNWGKITGINHISGSLIRLLILIPNILFFEDWLYFLVTIITEYILYWIYFELRLNKRRKLDYLHIGNSSTMDLKVKKFLGKDYELNYFKIKLILFILSSIGSIYYGYRI